MEVLEVRDVPPPQLSAGEVLIDVAATAVNRADVMQRQGKYPPPPGASDILGLECAGTVSAVADGVTGWKPGDQVCALLAGGGYAEQVAVPEQQVMPLPQGLSLTEAAALPEAMCTVWSNVFMTAALQPEELLLVHGGSSGIGTAAIQLATALGARVACTVGTPEKAHACARLGADLTINYREQDFVDEIRRYDERGANVILDIIGADYLKPNVEALATEGRLVVIGMQSGAKAELNLATLLTRRAAVIATALRSRPLQEKGGIVRSVVENVWPLVADGAVRPIIHARLPLADVAEAHRLLESSSHIGKVVLDLSP